MRVFVIHDCVRMLALGVEPHQHVILVGPVQKHPGQLELSFGQICRRFEGAEILFVLDGKHSDGTEIINLYLIEKSMEDGAHALELIGHPARLFLV